MRKSFGPRTHIRVTFISGNNAIQHFSNLWNTKYIGVQTQTYRFMKDFPQPQPPKPRDSNKTRVRTRTVFLFRYSREQGMCREGREG